jgi:homoserine dehydrogenase
MRRRTRTVRTALVGLGNVGRTFVERLTGSYDDALREEGVAVKVTGIATRRHGIAIDPRGLDVASVLREVKAGRSLSAFHSGPVCATSRRFVETVPADVLLEVTPLDPRRGEPATTYVRAALKRGLHVITANKGPTAFALQGLRGLARRKGRLFLHEGAVLDGVPVFNLVERCLPGAKVLSFRGTLNGTTSLVLSRMEEGLGAAQAVREAQSLGIAEADPGMDLEGWDAAVKGCALAYAFWGIRVPPRRVRRTGIGGVTPRDVRRAVGRGERLRLVVRGERVGRGARVTVRPERIPLGDPLAGDGGDSALVLETDLLGEIAVVERGGTVDQTAYALLSDLLTIVRSTRGGTGDGRKPTHGI